MLAEVEVDIALCMTVNPGGAGRRSTRLAGEDRAMRALLGDGRRPRGRRRHRRGDTPGRARSGRDAVRRGRRRSSARPIAGERLRDRPARRGVASRMVAGRVMVHHHTCDAHHRPHRQRPPSFRSVARMLLETEGYEVVGEAPDGEAASSLPELKPDVVLLDLGLPGHRRLRGRAAPAPGGRDRARLRRDAATSARSATGEGASSRRPSCRRRLREVLRLTLAPRASGSGCSASPRSGSPARTSC